MKKVLALILDMESNEIICRIACDTYGNTFTSLGGVNWRYAQKPMSYYISSVNLGEGYYAVTSPEGVDELLMVEELLK